MGSEGPLPAHSRGHVGPGALAKMKEKQDKGKPKPGAAVRNLNLHNELIHSADGDSFMTRDRKGEGLFRKTKVFF